MLRTEKVSKQTSQVLDQSVYVSYSDAGAWEQTRGTETGSVRPLPDILDIDITTSVQTNCDSFLHNTACILLHKIASPVFSF